jgi:hypothetical protein
MGIEDYTLADLSVIRRRWRETAALASEAAGNDDPDFHREVLELHELQLARLRAAINSMRPGPTRNQVDTEDSRDG